MVASCDRVGSWRLTITTSELSNTQLCVQRQLFCAWRSMLTITCFDVNFLETEERATMMQSPVRVEMLPERILRPITLSGIEQL